MRCLPALLCAAALLALLAGCGEEEGVQSGATISVYVDSGLCAGARSALAGAGGEAGELRVKALCLDDPHRGSRLDLATVGANARRATEDSTAVAVIETTDDEAASRFARPILDSASIPRLSSSSGAEAMRQVLAAIAGSDSGSLRDSVAESLSSE